MAKRAQNRAIPISELRKLIAYNPRTGQFWYRERPDDQRFNTRCAERPAARMNVQGYRYVAIMGVKYRAARVAYALVMGEWPKGLVDHRNRKRADDRWENIRPATFVQNSWNRRAKTGSSSAFKGVSLRKDRGKYTASAKGPDGRMQNLGLFPDEIAAAEAYDRFVLKHCPEPEFAVLNFPMRSGHPQAVGEISASV